MTDRPPFHALCVHSQATSPRPYVIDLYETHAEAEADLPRAKRKWGQNVWIEERPR